MSETVEQPEQVAREAQAHLQSLDGELAAIPSKLKAAEAETIKARDEKAILDHIKSRKRLEERREVLPILIRHQRIAVLKARAEIYAATNEQARAALPEAITEEAETKAAFEDAEMRYKAAQQLRMRLANTADGAQTSRQLLLDDADALSEGRPTKRYFL